MECGSVHFAGRHLIDHGNYYKTWGRVFVNGGENDAKQYKRLERLLISYFILLFRNKESVISNYILLCCSKSYIILVVDFS